jgi:hypothetical protein
MIREVTCGDMNLEGVKIMIPPERYGAVLDRLRALGRTYSWFDPVGSFLAVRCSGDFLKRYYGEVEEMSTLPKYLRAAENYDDSLRILRRLHADGLLPEHIRKDAVKRICNLSETKYSLNFMQEHIVGCLLTDEEVNFQLDNLKDVVLSNEYEIISKIKSKWDGDGDPEDQFCEIVDTLNFFEEEGSEEEGEHASSFLSEIKNAVSEMEENRPPATEYENLEAEETSVAAEASIRSIFEDIDE